MTTEGASREADGRRSVRRRDPERARASILAAATAEFAALGIGGARVDAIAAQAGVNKRMLYHYFGNKDGLYLAVLEEAYAAIRAAESDLVLGKGSPANAMRKLVLFTWRYYREHPEFLSLLATENVNQGAALATSARIRELNSPLIETIRSLLEQGVAEGEFRRGVDPFRLYVSICALCFFYLANRWTLSVSFGRDLGAPDEVDAWGEHVVGVILGYLRP
ncbi:MAG TPA: TetR/AcrR family transcriptional regulator [Rhizobiaceae bacterium]